MKDSIAKVVQEQKQTMIRLEKLYAMVKHLVHHTQAETRKTVNMHIMRLVNATDIIMLCIMQSPPAAMSHHSEEKQRTMDQEVEREDDKTTFLYASLVVNLHNM